MRIREKACTMNELQKYGLVVLFILHALPGEKRSEGRKNGICQNAARATYRTQTLVVRKSRLGSAYSACARSGSDCHAIWVRVRKGGEGHQAEGEA